MSLTPGTRVGPYEITGPLGAGGMGEVFKARDTRLGREVAIKALPVAFAHDPERLARFEREARLLASLNHPNIAGIFGLEEADGARYLALELVDGETLAERLTHGPLPLDEALDVVRQIAAGVEAAHENDVVHRDLKPGNVMLRGDGTVKVLDFGLAKSGGSDRSGVSHDLLSSPTMTYAGTEVGVILGTAAYMSPEQARGKSVDKRTDVWSFGCVLFECLTGKQAFAGETVSDIVARILQTEPEWASLPANTPERVRALLARCLEKDAKRRLRDIGEARIEIEHLSVAPVSAIGQAAATPPRKLGLADKLPWRAIAIVALVAAIAPWVLPRLLLPPLPPAPIERFEVAAPKGRTLFRDAANITISPDGAHLAMIAHDSSGVSALWLRPLNALMPRMLPGTEDVQQMFWSPDSRSIAFFAGDRALRKIAIDGGKPERICETKAARGGCWGKDGTILLAPYSSSGIFKVSADGGTPVQLTHPDSSHGVTGHRFPLFLPDGKHFLFSTVPAGPDGKGGLCVGSLDGGPVKEVARGENGVAWLAPGWLVTTRNATLVAWRFDDRALKFVGEPVKIGDLPHDTQYSGGPIASASRAGTLAFLTKQPVPARLSWYDLTAGREVGAPPLPLGLYDTVQLAPGDHQALMTVSTEPNRRDIVLADLDRGVITRISDSPEDVFRGAISPDGALVGYLDQTTQTVRVRSLVEGSTRTILTGDRVYKRVYGFTADGRELLYGRLDAATKWDLWLLPLDGSPARPLLATPANELAGAISKDGRWLKYESDDAGVNEAFIAPFLKPGSRYQVTVGGGGGVISRDGTQFIYAEASHPDDFMIAEIKSEPALSLGPPRKLPRLPDGWVDWDITTDNKRILLLMPAEKATPQAVTVLQGWWSGGRGK